jgi:hypothetical protein
MRTFLQHSRHALAAPARDSRAPIVERHAPRVQRHLAVAIHRDGTIG